MSTTVELEGARLLPGVTVEQIEQRVSATRPPGGADGIKRGVTATRDLVRGRALIFWDPKAPGKKLDAIDTDQITPSADCVSESLSSLDARWKAGAFRHLMPDFRARVARGENFVIVGDRFAIGSSREMSPAGLKAIGEENGRELVIVCGANMGDIFRRNALNLGLHVVQAPDAVADARDGHEFSFDPDSRVVTNVTLGKTYVPISLTKKEDEIRQSGGIFNIGRREFVSSVKNPPRVTWPDSDLARRMTTTEQIVWSHRVDKDADVFPGATLSVYADLLPGSDGTAPFAIHTFNQITGGDTIRPRRAAVANDHFVFTGKSADERQTAISQAFADRYDIRKPFFATPGDGIFHFYFPEQGLIFPGGVYPGADSHSRAYGAYGAVGIGIGSTTLGFGWSTGYIYFTLARQRRVRFVGLLQPWVTGKDIVLALLRKWGAAQAQGMSVELVDVERQLPMAYRNTIANMMAEAEALNGIFAQDEITERWYARRGVSSPEGQGILPYPPLSPGSDAHYDIDEELSLSAIRPQIALPFHPSNAEDAEDFARQRQRFDKALIGSCTNGSYDDLLQAALVLRLARHKGIDRRAEGTDFVIFPGSRAVKEQIELADKRLGGESIAEVFRSFGGQIRDSWCGPCFGQGADALKPGERAITSFNRNWQNRMGVGGEGYLASPAVVAASVLAGYMAPPGELGIEWDARLFEI